MDLKIGSGSVVKSKNETDIRLLQACKTQLSSEVIKWKTECLRLQKERDAERLRAEAREQAAQNCARQMLQLQHHLSAAEEENKRLKEKASCVSYVSALERLSTSLNKFHSYPWADTTQATSSHPSAKRSLPVPEDWREVSQRYLEKMKREMRELRELNCDLSVKEDCAEPSTTSAKEAPDAEGSDQVVESALTGLISETVSLKQSLQEQNSHLQRLLRKANKIKQRTQGIEKKVQSQNPEPSWSINPDPSTKQNLCTNQLSRHSDDSFREFFTKQLEGCQNREKPGPCQKFAGPEVPVTNRRPPDQCCINRDKSSEVSDSEKVCPICQTSFDRSVPQTKFEEHVLDHLETESASLLDQYVVL